MALFQVDTDEGQQACDELGIKVIPTVQFWKSGAKLWEHKGIVELENDLGEGKPLHLREPIHESAPAFCAQARHMCFYLFSHTMGACCPIILSPALQLGHTLFFWLLR